MAPKYASKKEILGVSRIGAKGFLLDLASGSGSRAPLHTESIAHRSLAPRWLPGARHQARISVAASTNNCVKVNLEKVKAARKCLWEAGGLANGFAPSNYHGRRH